MRKLFFVQVLSVITCSSAMLYSYINTQNALVAKRIALPHLSCDVQILNEENARLEYEIQQFENPKHLMELMNTHAFAHLKYANEAEVLNVDMNVQQSGGRSMLATR